ncbi:amino acid permease family protein [Trichinella spiralis]|uniref:amino acid permease family protein n=1 Tax=Trichinella spiralis TaxID=6334 RepID=UPI0001EFC6BC|nr:amino acid permease family protein [Trichinella spiralis]
MDSSNTNSNRDETTAVGNVTDVMNVCKSSQNSRCIPLGEYVQKNEALLENRFKKSAKLGTMLGVFLPTIQNIFGVIMFIRLHWIVGMAGLIQSLIIVSMCSFLTFLTSISLSAIATNGVFEEGGPYFVISRNLSPEFGASIGILFFLANAVATAMYVVGHVEVFLTYVAQDLPQFGTALLRTDEEMANNFRIYGTILLLIIVCIAACGVKVTQTFAPISLFCVIISIIGVYTGSFVYNNTDSDRICMVGDKAIKRLPLIVNGTIDSSCTKEENGTLWNLYCGVNSSGNGTTCDPYFLNHNVTLRIVRHGMLSQHYKNNLHSYYMKAGEAAPGEKGLSGVEVTQDITSTFYTLLAIYFPAVTGIMTGCNLSGDLADPQHSIPVGTIAAQLTTSFVFISYTLFYGTAIDRALLMDKYGESLGGSLVSGQLSWPTEWLVVVGCLASTFGAGLQSLFSAARLIQAVAKDNLVAKLQSFGKVTSKNEPCRALLLSAFIAELTILIGAVDHIAPIVDFFFLICYCFINIACTLQTLLKMPNWRPRFKYYHWTLSLLGAILGFFIMFSTHFDYAVIVPHVLLFIKPDKTKEQIMKDPALLFAAALEEGGGFLMLTTFIEMKEENDTTNQLISAETAKLKDVLKTMKIKAYVRVIPCKDVGEAVWIHTLGAGIGGLRPNIIITDWPHRLKTWKMTNVKYWDFLSSKSLIIPKGHIPSLNETLSGNIDVWWLAHDGGMQVMLTVLLKKHRIWKNCKVRIYAVVNHGENLRTIHDQLKKWVYNLRIDAKVEVVEMPLLKYDQNDEVKNFLSTRRKLAAELGLEQGDEKKAKEETDQVLDTKDAENQGSESSEESTISFDEAIKDENVTWKTIEKRFLLSVYLNELMRRESGESRLLIINLPEPPSNKQFMPIYLDYVDTLTTKLKAVILVRGTQKDVITIFS